MSGCISSIVSRRSPVLEAAHILGLCEEKLRFCRGSITFCSKNICIKIEKALFYQHNIYSSIPVTLVKEFGSNTHTENLRGEKKIETHIVPQKYVVLFHTQILSHWYGDMPLDLPETNTSRVYLFCSSKFCGISQKKLKTNLKTVFC